MRRMVAFLVLAALFLSTLGLGVSAEMSVTATYQDGVLTLSWSGAPAEFSLVSVTVGETSYPVTGENSATLPILLTEDTSGTCTFSNGTFNLDPKPTFTVTAGLQITSVYDPETKTLSGTWSSECYTVSPITHVRVKDTDYPVTEIDPGSFSADLSALTEPGTYTVSYVIAAGTGTATLPGDVSFTIEDTSAASILKAEKVADGEYKVTLTDGSGAPIADADVTMLKDDQFLLKNTTNAEGVAAFYQTLTPEEETAVSWRFEGGELNAVVYQSSTAVLEITPDSTTSTTDTTTTTGSFTSVTASTTYTPSQSASATTTTTKRWPTVSSTTRKTTTSTSTTIKVEMGGLATGRYDTGVMVNALYDAALLKTFGIKASLFTERARLFMEQESYDALAGGQSAPLMLSIFPTEDQLPDSVLATALENSEEYGFYDPEDAQSFAVNLSIAVVNSKENYTVMDPQMIPKDTYTVYLPVPDAFRDCDLAVISLEQENAPIIEAITNNGSFSFEVDHFGSYAVVAFPTATRTLSVPTMAIVLFVLAGICLIAAGAVLYVFVIRSSRKTEELYDDNAQVLLSFDDGMLEENVLDEEPEDGEEHPTE